MKKELIILFIILNGVLKAQENHIYLADPTIYSENGIYYMYGTEKKPQQGFPVYVSKDLKNWQPGGNTNGYAFLKGKDNFGTQGFWAPQLFKRNGTYFMVYTANENIAISQSNSPLGPFRQKLIVPLDSTTRKIDPFVFIDDDGKIYLYHVRLNKGNTIWVAELDTGLSRINGETLKQCIYPTVPWENTQLIKSPPIAEGPTVVKHKGVYYLFYSANDFRSIDYAVGYATAPTPKGPWEKFKGNPIISRKILGINGTGHGDVFRDFNGHLNYIFHSHFNDSTVQNRRTFIVRMQFVLNKNADEPDEVRIDKNTLIEPIISK
ncbi:MAG: glycoside hydrolase family 43 protein [Paludibacter sp.]|nr:glycoside hydrolase family 43 protein [Paludibacter sp.]